MDKPTYHGVVSSILPDQGFVLGVDLFPNPFEGRTGSVIDLTSWNAQMDKEESVGLLCPADARALALHLLNAADLAEQAEPNPGAGVVGVRKLPMVTLCGSRFIIDERLRQLRNAENPNHYFDLDDPFTR